MNSHKLMKLLLVILHHLPTCSLLVLTSTFCATIPAAKHNAETVHHINDAILFVRENVLQECFLSASHKWHE